MELEETLRTIAEECRLILVDHTVSGTDISPKVRVVVDTEEGVTVGELTEMSRRLKRSREMNRRFPGGFQLEVTSPGLDYPLTRDYQFRRHANRRVRIIHDDPLLPSPLEGVVKGVEGEDVIVETVGNTVRVSLTRISRGKLILT
ncbi:MAG: ribosome maturation factor RimP [Fidelibacterota bacterium]